MVLEPDIPLAVMEIGGGRRLAVAKDALCVEMRAGGVWARARAIPYDDIRALYRFQTTDWSGLSLLAGLWIALLLALLIAAAALRWSGGVTIAGTVGLTLFFLILGIVRGRGAPARQLRIEAYSGPLQVPERSATFYSALAGQLKPGPAAAPPPSPAASGATPIPPVPDFGQPPALDEPAVAPFAAPPEQQDEPAVAPFAAPPEQQVDATLPVAPPTTEHPTPNTEP